MISVGLLAAAAAFILFQNGSNQTTTVRAAGVAPVVRINQVMAGENGLSKVQFIELQVSDSNQNCWGLSQPGTPCNPGTTKETTGRYMLLFFDQNGIQTGRYVFMRNPKGRANTVLVATPGFAALPGAIIPDFTISQDVIPESGQVCFRGNPDNPNAGAINLCLAYGSFLGAQQNNAAPGDPVGGPFTGPLNGPPVVNASDPAHTLPTTDTTSLSRTNNVFGNQFNSDFALNFSPIAHNDRGQTMSFTVASTDVQGSNLFFNETFLGNGRTCSDCHTPQDDFGLSPATIASLPPDDPLFVAEFNLNTITLSLPSFPSDLRGVLTARNGTVVTQVYGTGNTYQIYGGSTSLIGQRLTDPQGNRGTVLTFTPGDLAPQPGVPFSGLEDPTLMHGGRALILENISGLDQPPVMRHSPNLINVGLTEPYGMSSLGIHDLDLFSPGAIQQHAPRSLARVAGVDFRLATQTELDDMTAFMNTIQVGESHNWDLNFFATTEAQKRGRDLFFGPSMCFFCHRGPRLELSIDKDQSDFFGTGVADQDVNLIDGLPLEKQFPGDTTNTRFFNSRQLWGLRNNTSLMHEGSAHNLFEGVQFYTTTAFTNSQFGRLIVEDMPSPMTLQNVNDITTFLTGLVDYPFEFTRSTNDFGSQAPNGGATASQTIVVTNNGTTNLTVDSVTVNGEGSSDFVVTSLPPPDPFGPGQTRSIDVAFDPVAAGLFCANLEFNVTDTSNQQSYPVGVPVRGTGSGGTLGPLTISSIADQTKFLTKPAGPLMFTVSDPGANASCVTVTATSSNQAMTPDSFLTLGGFDSTNRSITAASIPLTFGTSTITLTASDGVQSASTSFLFTVLNQQPPRTNCTTACMRSSILMGTTPTGVSAQVTVKDENGALISGANVSVTWTFPDLSTTTQIQSTDASGATTFQVTGGAGIYRIDINSIRLTGFTFDTRNSVVSASILK